jgi:hypothetical protein
LHQIVTDPAVIVQITDVLVGSAALEPDYVLPSA